MLADSFVKGLKRVQTLCQLCGRSAIQLVSSGLSVTTAQPSAGRGMFTSCFRWDGSTIAQQRELLSSLGFQTQNETNQMTFLADQSSNDLSQLFC